MTLNRIELKKILYDFNCIANRVMQAHYDDYNHALRRFIEYMNTAEVIKDYISDCGMPSFDVAEECKQVVTSHGRIIFELGETNQLEVANIYGILKYVLDSSDIHITSLGTAYSPSSRNFQDKVKVFNERVLMILIRHIENYLTKIGIDMGMDEHAKYVITVNNGQVNVASDNATIHAIQNNNFNSDELKKLIVTIKNHLSELSDEDKVAVNESLEVIENESKSDKPKKSMIKTALSALHAIKGTTEFSAAVFTLAQFLNLC